MKKFFLLPSSILLALTLAAHAQNYTVSTLAGNAGQASADGSGSSARFNNPWGAAVDAAGNVFVADTDSHIIRKITSGGAVSTLAGTVGVAGTNDATGTSAQFNSPQGIAVDATGNVYVADTGNHTIRKITSLGVVTTLAGSPTLSGTANGSGTTARFNQPEGLAINAAGTTLYVADTLNQTIRAVTTGGSVSTYAGTAGTAGMVNATGTGAQFNYPQGVAIDSSGNIYVGDTGNQLIRKIDTGVAVTTFAGTSGSTGSGDGAAGSATFWDPLGVAVDGSGNVYVADSFNNTIRKIASSTVSTPVGLAGNLGSADGSASAARFWQPQGLAVDISGNVYVADGGNGTIRKISGTTVTTLAGAASIGSADGTGNNARFFFASGACIDNSGNVYVADTQNHTIRTVTAAGVSSTLAGGAGISGTADNATGSNARFNAPQGIVRDSLGNLYVADTANHSIRKVTSTGTVTTFAGTSGISGTADGTGNNARFNSPQDLAIDGSGNLYVADSGNHTIRKITSLGVVTTFAGQAGNLGTSDGTGTAVGTNTARFYAPGGVAVDGSGNVYVADTYNHSIRKITSSGVVSTIAGLGGSYGSADGTTNNARFFFPQAIAVDSTGTNLFVLDTGNNTVRKLVLSGGIWTASTIAGTAGASGTADGNGSNARLFGPAGLGINTGGTLAIADLGNSTIRTASSSTGTAPAFTSQPQSQTVVAGQTATFTTGAAGTATLNYQWYYNGGIISGATTTAYSKVNAQTSDNGSYSVVVTNSVGSITSSNAILTVAVAPSITTAPQNQTKAAGTTASFSVVASGTAPLSYQWSFNSTPISGATTTSYSRANVQAADIGTYTVVVTNVAGSTSSSATLSVTPAAPTITGQPQSQSIGTGANPSFSVTASGTTPFTYQWRFNTGNINGATGSSYTVSNAQPGDQGSYSVVVSNSVGGVTSSDAVLTISAAPGISVQPLSQLTFVGSNVTFTVGATGTTPSYQWLLNGSPISGATLSAYSISPVQWSSAGSYSVVVTNNSGSTNSANATLVVQQMQQTWTDGFEGYSVGVLPNDFGGPNSDPSNPWWAASSGAQSSVTNSSIGVTPHGGANMAVHTPGGNNFQQEWVNLPYRFNAGSNYYGNFLCEWWFYDPYGFINLTSASNYQDYIAVGSYSPVSTTSDTVSQTTIYSRISFGAFNTTGFNVSNYQARVMGTTGQFGSGNSWYNTSTKRSVGWHHARMIWGVPDANRYASLSMFIDNMTNATLIPSNDGTNTGFNVIEMNHANTSSGYFDDLTFRAASDPWIVEQPQSATVVQGNTTVFTTVAVGTSYQWQLNGTNVANATSTAYTIASAATANAGTYNCLITGTNGTISTTTATLTVYVPPQITAQPTNQTVNQGQPASFSVTANGTAPIGYQWYLNNSQISGATSSSYSIGSATSGNAGSYTVVLNNAGGTTTSSVATLTVIVPPGITGQPSNVTANQGQNAIFTVTASGTSPSYQWRYNGGAISGATASSYTRTSVQSSDAGSYSVVVTNAAGSATSTDAILTVIVPPAIGTQPGNVTANQGQNATFTVTASGTSPGYQWRLNGGTISGATASSYTRLSVQPGDAGSYSVVVTNAAGSVTSSNAILTVIVPPSITTQPTSKTVLQGANANFSVVATGTSPSYQWRFNSTPIANATGSAYVKASAQSADQGTYSVVITNNAGSVTSSNATLTVFSTPTPLLSIVANADNTIGMQWQTTANTTYTLQYKGSLLGPQWTNIASYTSNTTSLSISDNPAGDTQRSYQLATSAAVSELGGYLQLTLLGNSDNFISIPFGRAPAISALVGSVSGNTITASSSPGWTANQFVYSSGVQTNTYFVRFTSGAAEGRIYQITANDTTSVTVNLGTDSLAAVAPNDGFSIESYWTLNTVFPNGKGILTSPTQGNRYTEILIPDLTSAGINLSATKFYYYWNGAWRIVGQSGSFNDDILQPNAYFIVRNNVPTNTVMTTVGRVITADIVNMLRTQASTSQDNYIGLQRPVPISLDDSGLISSGAFNASPLPGSRTDELLIFDNTVAARNKSSSASYYYWSGAWRQVGSGTTDVGTDQVFQPGTGVIIRKATNNTAGAWTNSATWTQ